MKLFKLCVRTSLLLCALACASAEAWGQQVIGYPASTARQDRSPGAQYPNPESDGPGSVPDPGRLRRNRERSEGRLHYPPSARVIPAEIKLTDAQKRRLYPSAAERAPFAALLRQDGTGMARLLPYVECNDDPRVLNVKGPCLDGALPVPGRGAFYSFKRKKHEARLFADLALHNARFRVGFAHQAVGVITTLGNVPLDSVTLQSSAVAPLAQLAPAKTLDEMINQYERSRGALAASHHAFGTNTEALTDTTYVLRSTAYQSHKRKTSDVLVAFRVIRQDADGSATIVWKRLRTPKS